MRTKLGDDEDLAVDMAPLIDCVFLLLIFFLVATTLKKIDKELPLDLPDAKASLEVQQPEDYAIIAVDRDNVTYLDGTPVATSLLHAELKSRVAANPEVKVRLDVDRAAEFAAVMAVLDHLRFYNITNVGVNTLNERHVKLNKPE
ncbi:MAG: biopolymer transporter ExbD [Planctomycetota bacterium]|jgi:biopolymer transport protein ExbD|nr:biopolymer transporter ExbD [Planctomycetota bacterium]